MMEKPEKLSHFPSMQIRLQFQEDLTGNLYIHLMQVLEKLGTRETFRLVTQTKEPDKGKKFMESSRTVFRCRCTGSPG